LRGETQTASEHLRELTRRDLDPMLASPVDVEPLSDHEIEVLERVTSVIERPEQLSKGLGNSYI